MGTAEEGSVSRGYELVFKDIEVRIGKRDILSDVHGVAKPGEMLAIMGPSGSGKTTLLNCLAGRRSMESGSITMNSRLINKQLRRKISFVLQNDIFLSELTCWDTIWYTALLRLPGSMPMEEKKRRVNDIIDTLDMRKCLKTKIGDASHRGLSGGEKKRTTIACELLTNPALMLLDEPTSGLDSSTAYSLCATIKKFAKASGKTVIMTIHQPSSKIFNTFDKLLLLCEGRVAYYGDIQHCANFFSRIDLPCPRNYNLADHILDLVKETEEVKAKIIQGGVRQREESWYPKQLRSTSSIVGVVYENGTNHTERAALLDSGEVLLDSSNNSIGLTEYPKRKLSATDVEIGSLDSEGSVAYEDSDELRFKKEYDAKWPTSFWNQYTVLVKRSFWQALPRIISKWHLIQVIVTSTIGGLIWFNMERMEDRIPDRQGLLYFAIIFTGFLGLVDAMLSFPVERTVLNKERLAGYYRLSAYYLAKLSSDGPLVLVLPTIHITLTYWLAVLNLNFGVYLQMLCLILMSATMGHSIALFYSALILDMSVSIMFSTTTMLVLLITGGIYSTAVPVWMAWVKYCSYLQHLYYAAITVDFTNIHIRCPSDVSKYPDCYAAPNSSTYSNSSAYIPQTKLLTQYTLYADGWKVWHHLLIIFALMIIARTATYIVLRFIRKPTIA